MQHRYTTLLLLLALQVVFYACKKKVDEGYDNRPNQEPLINSTTRLVNLLGAKDLQIGEEKLTSFAPPEVPGSGAIIVPRLTRYFPETGQLGTTYLIPQQFVGGDGYIRDLQMSMISGGNWAPGFRAFDLKDHGRTPMDYYYIRANSGIGDYQDTMLPIPRDVSPSADPTKIRVRLLNLSTTNNRYSFSGSMTLTWADGTPVDSRTSHIAPGSLSGYIEIPYGTYQFKVTLDADGREVPAKANGGAFINILDPFTGTLMWAGGIGTPGPGTYTDTWLTYAPLKTYQPGGVYTIVVADVGGYSEAQDGSLGQADPIYVNSFHIISDISEPANLTYARIQAVNTLSGKQVKWQIDNREIGTTPFAAHTGYSIFVTGTYVLRATDAQGAILAEKEIALQPGDNMTAWCYTGKDGQPAISFSSNNLSTVYNEPVNGNDGSYAASRDGYPWWIRFMNFCPELAEATFTSSNGVLLNGEGSRHVLYGIQPVNDVYTRHARNFDTDIQVYASSPGVLPGDWVSTVASLKSRDFISNINLYKTPAKPNSEPGIYTVALLGNTGATATEKARMIIIKHNQ